MTRPDGFDEFLRAEGGDALVRAARADDAPSERIARALDVLDLDPDVDGPEAVRIAGQVLAVVDRLAAAADPIDRIVAYNSEGVAIGVLALGVEGALR